MTYELLKQDHAVQVYIRQADAALEALGFTEHSFAHVTRVATVAADILEKLGYDERTVELAQIAAYMHDIGNVVNRIDHAQSGAVMAFRLLDRMGMPAEEIAIIVSAIGNHDEKTAAPVNPIAAALIISDKSDVRRSRVRLANRESADITFEGDIHDRVNYAVKRSDLYIEKDSHIELDLDIDTSVCAVMDYFEIFLERMMLCRKAAEKLGLAFRLTINKQPII